MATVSPSEHEGQDAKRQSCGSDRELDGVSDSDSVRQPQGPHVEGVDEKGNSLDTEDDASNSQERTIARPSSLRGPGPGGAAECRHGGEEPRSSVKEVPHMGEIDGERVVVRGVEAAGRTAITAEVHKKASPVLRRSGSSTPMRPRAGCRTAVAGASVVTRLVLTVPLW